MRLSYVFFMASTALPLLAMGFTPEEEAWLNDDSDILTQSVSGGELNFLEPKENFDGHHHQNRITIYPSSLDDGWVTLNQCHDRLDVTGRVQIVYNPHRVRDLEITEQHNIDSAWVEGPSVQLNGVQPGARLCIRSRSQALTPNDDGSYSLHNGPFMRRFLDGYYPMHVTVDIRLPEDYLSFERITPSPQHGLHLQQQDNRVRMDAWFEGQLFTEIRFKAL